MLGSDITESGRTHGREGKGKGGKEEAKVGSLRDRDRMRGERAKSTSQRYERAQ